VYGGAKVQAFFALLLPLPIAFINFLKKVFIDPIIKSKPTIIGIKIGINAILEFVELSK
jgi:hypothetical protein